MGTISGHGVTSSAFSGVRHRGLARVSPPCFHGGRARTRRGRGGGLKEHGAHGGALGPTMPRRGALSVRVARRRLTRHSGAPGQTPSRCQAGARDRARRVVHKRDASTTRSSPSAPLRTLKERPRREGSRQRDEGSRPWLLPSRTWRGQAMGDTGHDRNSTGESSRRQRLAGDACESDPNFKANPPPPAPPNPHFPERLSRQDRSGVETLSSATPAAEALRSLLGVARDLCLISAGPITRV